MTNKTLAFPAFNPTVGDIEGNRNTILQKYNTHKDSAALVVFPELCVTGYPLEDLLFRDQFLERAEAAIEEIAKHVGETPLIIGAPLREDGQVYNAAIVLQNQRTVAVRQKVHLPNYDVFDEQRYFSAGNISQPPVNVAGLTFALLICEDTWFPDPMRSQIRLGGQFAISINASPWDNSKDDKRKQILYDRATENGVHIAYTNQIGGQDELVFDGGVGIGAPKYPTQFLNNWYEDRDTTVAVMQGSDGIALAYNSIWFNDKRLNGTLEALTLGLRDYVNKNGFKDVVLGISGGVDSALAAALAVRALGKERVLGIMMPTEYTSDTSLKLAKSLCSNLGIRYEQVGVGDAYGTVLSSLEPLFDGRARDVTEENLQARIRGAVLMAVSNKMGSMVLSTGNKSEMAVGYSTLYGDMVGGFNVLKDVWKTEVYDLCNYMNEIEDWDIPEGILRRQPSAELAHDQVDTDSLPDYYTLDSILRKMIEREESVTSIYRFNSYDRATVERVRKMIDRNEYKRRQAPPGVRVSAKSLAGRDRRYPITNRYVEHVPEGVDNITDWLYKDIEDRGMA